MLNLESKKPLLAEMEKRQLEVVVWGTLKNRLLKSPGGDMRFSCGVVIRGAVSPNQSLLNLAEVNGLA